MNFKDLINNAADAIIAKLNLSADEQKFEATATLEDGTEIFTPDPEWVAGVAVFTRTPEGEPVAVGDGEYVLSTGEVLVVADGVLAEIRPMGDDSSEEDMSAVAEALSKIAEAFNAKLEEVKQSFTSELEALRTENKEIKETLSKQPAKPSVKKTEKVAQPLPQGAKQTFSSKIEKTLELLNK